MSLPFINVNDGWWGNSTWCQNVHWSILNSNVFISNFYCLISLITVKPLVEVPLYLKFSRIEIYLPNARTTHYPIQTISKSYFIPFFGVCNVYLLFWVLTHISWVTRPIWKLYFSKNCIYENRSPWTSIRGLTIFAYNFNIVHGVFEYCICIEFCIKYEMKN